MQYIFFLRLYLVYFLGYKTLRGDLFFLRSARGHRQLQVFYKTKT